MKFLLIVLVACVTCIASISVVLGVDNFDCAIYDAKITLNPNVGGTVLGTGVLKNNETNGSIVHATCRLYIKDTAGRVVSYGEEGNTGAGGIILVKDMLEEGTLIANTTYTTTIRCLCIGNYSTADTTRPTGATITSQHDACFIDDTGMSINRRACDVSVSLTTGYDYDVPENYGMILAALILIPCCFSIAFAIAGLLLDDKLWMLKYLFVFFQFLFLIISGYLGSVAVKGRNVNQVIESLANVSMSSTYILIAIIVIVILTVIVVWLKYLKNARKMKMEY